MPKKNYPSADDEKNLRECTYLELVASLGKDAADEFIKAEAARAWKQEMAGQEQSAAAAALALTSRRRRTVFAGVITCICAAVALVTYLIVAMVGCDIANTREREAKWRAAGLFNFQSAELDGYVIPNSNGVIVRSITDHHDGAWARGFDLVLDLRNKEPGEPLKVVVTECNSDGSETVSTTVFDLDKYGPGITKFTDDHSIEDTHMVKITASR